MSQTIVTNKLNRTTYPERKVELYHTLQEPRKVIQRYCFIPYDKGQISTTNGHKKKVQK